MRSAAKAIAHGVATIAVTPFLVSFAIRRAILGTNRALEGSTQALSLVPGLAGDYLRRAFLARTLAQQRKPTAFERSVGTPLLRAEQRDAGSGWSKAPPFSA